MKHLQVLLFVFLLFCYPGNGRSQSYQEQLKQIKSTVVEKIDGREYYIHTIRRGQTLYMISKAYGVDVNELIRENPGVKDGIKADEKLRIPVPGQKTSLPSKGSGGKDKTATTAETQSKPVENVTKPDTLPVVELPCGQDTTTKKAIYQVALMLPLFLSGVDQIDAVNPDPKIFETCKSFQFLPFYEGFIMALDSLNRQGAKIKLFVYDVDKDTARTRQILRNPEMKSMDLIFGLLYAQNFKIVSAFARKNKINLVNPISEKSEVVAGNPYVFKVQPSKKDQFEHLATYLAANAGKGQVIIIRNGQYGDRDAADQLKKACLDHQVKAVIVEGQEAAIVRFSREKPNYIVAFSEKQEYVLDLLRGMYKIRNEYDLTLIGLPLWSEMDGLENEYLVALKTHMLARNFIDYESEPVIQFVRIYQDRYKTDPELLAFQGFDQAFYFLKALQKYGTNIGRCLSDHQINSLETRFDFSQTKGNGFENHTWLIYRYENYKLIKVN